MSKTAKVYTYNKKTGELRSSRMGWDGEYPTDQNGFGKNGYRKLETLGDEYGLEYDIYTNEKGWLFMITAFQEYVATIRTAAPLLYLKTIADLAETSKSVAKAMALAEAGK